MFDSSDLTLYLVTDRGMLTGHSVTEMVEAAIRGGVTMVQLREKEADSRTFYELAVELRNILHPLNVPLIINDRLDVALAADADGVHLGQSDLPVLAARKLMGPNKIIGLSVESMEEVYEAEHLPVNYLGISPIYSTETKTDTKLEWGLDGIRNIRKTSSHPLVAIGGINASNTADIIQAGSDGIAVVSAICASYNPEKSAAELKNIIHNTMESMP